MSKYQDKITSLKSTINHLKIEFEQFQKVGNDLSSTSKDASTGQKRQFTEEDVS